MENTTKQKGKVTKWLPEKRWGIINFYPPDSNFNNTAPHKAFFHLNNLVSKEQPVLGSRVMFVLGPSRSATELPSALKVRVIVSEEQV